MLVSRTVNLKWNSKIKKHYVDLGYKFTNMNDTFEVKVEDLTSGSCVKVDMKCDYCGSNYQKPWYRYIAENNKSLVHKDCCNKCKKHKIQESTFEKYGVTTVFKLENIKNKISSTNFERYGASNPFASDSIKEKIRSTNIQKYGFPSPIQNKDVLDKVTNTCLKKYGVKYYVLTQHFSGEDSPVWKGGLSYVRNERGKYDYISWRNKVFSKNHYTCQCCGECNGGGKTIKLNAHHIKNWKDNIEQRYDEDNGITLCVNCHIKFHSIYGKNNNTKEQLDEFLNSYGKKIC